MLLFFSKSQGADMRSCSELQGTRCSVFNLFRKLLAPGGKLFMVLYRQCRRVSAWCGASTQSLGQGRVRERAHLSSLSRMPPGSVDLSVG